MKVGFVGLGSMGYGLAMLLAKSGQDVTVFDVFPKALEPFAGKAKVAGSLAELGAGADVVGLCVRDDAQVNECADALLPSMRPDSVLLIHSTVKPATMQALAARAAARQVHVLDAAVTRTVTHTQEVPFVFCLLGGDETIAERVQPVLAAYSTDTIHVGGIGAGMALKIVNNLGTWCEIMVGLEALTLSRAAGVPTDKLLTVMKRNGCLTPSMEGMMQACLYSASSPELQALVRSQAGIGEKDLSLAEELGQGAGVEAPIGSFLRSRIVKTLGDMVSH